MSASALLLTIPYVALHRMEPVADGVRVRLPFRSPLANMVGTMHAGALYTVAETAAGMAAYETSDGAETTPLLRSARVRYLRRVTGDVEATASVADEVAAWARNAFAEHGRAELAVDAVVLDSSGTTVLEATFEYALRRREEIGG